MSHSYGICPAKKHICSLCHQSCQLKISCIRESIIRNVQGVQSAQGSRAAVTMAMLKEASMYRSDVLDPALCSVLDC